MKDAQEQTQEQEVRLERAKGFLGEGDLSYERPSAAARLTWAKQDLANVIQLLERQKTRYRVYQAVGNKAAMELCEKAVADILKDFDAWSEVITELEQEAEAETK